ncbi:hypothetical protein ACLOJK_020047 [Asimina triloba]
MFGATGQSGGGCGVQMPASREWAIEAGRGTYAQRTDRQGRGMRVPRGKRKRREKIKNKVGTKKSACRWDNSKSPAIISWIRKGRTHEHLVSPSLAFPTKEEEVAGSKDVSPLTDTSRLSVTLPAKNVLPSLLPSPPPLSLFALVSPKQNVNAVGQLHARKKKKKEKRELGRAVAAAAPHVPASLVLSAFYSGGMAGAIRVRRPGGNKSENTANFVPSRRVTSADTGRGRPGKWTTNQEK